MGFTNDVLDLNERHSGDICMTIFEKEQHHIYFNANIHLNLSTTGNIQGSLVPRPIPRFSMLHTEKWEGLVREVT